ncbi:MAG: translation initiation factor IF-2 [Geobacteraceae bacterium]|nr:translation initiation factor IF-2 [Geobacteraceae bacterium]
MAKIRIYELAQRLGLGNKELLKRLRDKGVEAKSHMSVIDEDTVREFEENTPSSGAEQQETIAEERISTGLIRRRRKPQPPKDEVEKAASAPEASQSGKKDGETDTRPASSVPDAQQDSESAATVKQTSAVAPHQTDGAVDTADAEEQKPETASTPSVKGTDTSKDAAAQTLDSEEHEAAKPSGPEPPATAKRNAPTRHVASIVSDYKSEQKPQGATSKTGAKILGHVDLPKSAMRHDQRGGRKPAPADKRKTHGGARPTTGARPASGARPEGAPAAGSRAPGPKAPGSKAPTFVDVPVDPDSDKGRDQRRRKKKSKGANDYAEGTGGKKRERVEVYKPDRMGRNRKGRKNQQPSRQTEITVPKAIKRKIRISDVITVGELAKRMGVKANDLIKELMRQGSMVTINHPLDFESAAILAADFNYEVENVAFDEGSVLGTDDDISIEDDSSSANSIERPPVVTIMGHVDHGKTSLLDAIRSAHIADDEAGGITQHIGAYDVQVNDKTISFLDTPGHEAFTAMRSRGAQVTDIVILVVAADDGVMPQTREAISHSKAAGVPIIIAVNKMDKPGANPERVKQELTEFELVPEDWGGDTIFVEVSAKQRTNLDSLLEMVLLQAEVLDLKADPTKRCRGTIVEARLDKGRGAVATVLVQDGTLKIGDPIVAGLHQGRVRTMINDRGEQVKEAGPSIPVEVTGLQGVPEAGDNINAVESEKLSKEVAQHRQHKSREIELAKSSRLSLDQLYARIKEGNVEELKVIIKADVQGSVEALKEALVKLSTSTCRLTVVHTAVGGIKESDVSLAAASDAIILGFSVRPEPKAAAMAENERVDIRLYSIIYDAVSDVRSAMEGLLPPTLKEKYLGRIDVRETFHVSKVGTIAGCIVQDGIARRNSLARLVRDNVVVWEGKLSSLKRFKEDAKEVKTGYECGIGLERYNDIKVGDVIETYEIIETKTEL